MLSFVHRHASKVIGALSGFDRVRLRGTLRWLANPRGMMNYLFAIQKPLKEFKEYAKDATQRVVAAGEQVAEAAGRPVEYLNSSALRKEDRAREIARADGITEGLICVLTCVEPCMSYRLSGDRQTKKLRLHYGSSKCLHQYFYCLDPQLGFLHLRLQTWFPFTMHVCINGRDWLGKQMDAAGLSYLRRDNCFAEVSDVPAAQRLLDRQLRVNWNSFLQRLTKQFHPVHRELFRDPELTYYWSIDESEWATDVMFRSPTDLQELYPRLIRHGMTGLSSPDVLRFLGRKPTVDGGLHGNFTGEVTTDLKHRPEGMRIKHRLNRNSIKMYDKQRTVLRVETTINDSRDMKVYRRPEGDSQAPKKWLRMRKGVADVRRRAQISQAANERYLESMAAVDGGEPLGALTAPLCRPATWKGQQVRALNPLAAEDALLLKAVNRGEFSINGFRNRDLRALLYEGEPADEAESRRRSSAVTRRMRMLRAHGLIAKVARTHRYVLTAAASKAIAALLAAQRADAAQLSQLAA